MRSFYGVVGSMNNPMQGFGEKASSGDDASLKWGLCGETATGERRGSLVK